MAHIQGPAIQFAGRDSCAETPWAAASMAAVSWMAPCGPGLEFLLVRGSYRVLRLYM